MLGSYKVIIYTMIVEENPNQFMDFCVHGMNMDGACACDMVWLRFCW